VQTASVTEDGDDIQTWTAAGLFSPDAPGAGDRLDLLRYLTAEGVGLEEMVARGDAALTRAAVDAVVHPRRVLTVEQVAGRTGLSREAIAMAWLALGLAAPPVDIASYNEEDLTLLSAFAIGRDLLGLDAILQFLRVMGAAMSQLAEAAVAGFIVNVEQPMAEDRAPPVVRARASTDAARAVLGVPGVLSPLFRRHFETAVERQRATQGEGSFDSYRLAVGFVDLVGYTEWAQTLSSSALAAAMTALEREAADRVTTAGGRVVKNIGDAVMFVTTDVAAACQAALALCEFVDAHPSLTRLRGSVASGDLLARDGDYFGPIVNLAARAVRLAPPGGVVSGQVVPGFRCHALPLTTLRGFEEPVQLYQIERDH